MLFKLFELTIGLFAIVKAEASEKENNQFPINVHGFIQVVDSWNSDTLTPILRENISDELASSNETDKLKEEAVERTIEAVSDEFGD